MSSRADCPSCGVESIRAGAVKCPACKAWIGPKSGSAEHTPIAVGIGLATLGGAGLAAIVIAILAKAPESSAAIAPPSAASSAVADSSANANAGTPANASAAAMSSARASASAIAAASSRASVSASAAPSAGSASFAPVLLADPRIIPLPAAPIDVAITDDDATVVVLTEDGSLLLVAPASAKVTRKIPVPGRGAKVVIVGGKYAAVLGAAGSLPIIDLATGAVAKLDVGGPAVDVVELANPPAIAVAGANSRRVARFALDGWKPLGDVTFARSVSGLFVGATQGKESLAVLTQGRRGGPAGTVESFDPNAVPFGGTRTIWSAAIEPRRGVAKMTDSGQGFVVDHASGQLYRFGDQRELRVADVGPHPLAAFREGAGSIVVVDASGVVTVVDAETLARRASIQLGAAPSAAAAFPDGRGVLVALGGANPKDRGASVALVTGDPPQLAGKIEIGPGVRAVTVGRSGKLAAAIASIGRSLALFDRK